METTISKSEIQDLILKHYEVDEKITPTKLNLIYPQITKQVFSGNYVALKRRNWDKEKTKKLDLHSQKRINKLYSNLENSSEKEDINSFGGMNKIIARDLMVKWTNESNVVGECFSFSHIKCELERLILKHIPKMTFISAETKPSIFKAFNRFQKTAKLPIKNFNGEAYDVLRKLNPNSLAHAYLDFCGQLPTVSREIKMVLDNDLVQINGIVAITVAKTIRKNSTNYYNNLWENFYRLTTNQVLDNRTNSDVANFCHLMLLMNERYTLREVFNYNDTSPMTLFVLQRLR